MLSPSQFVKDICHLPDVAREVATEDSSCGVCGVPIAAGEIVESLELPKTFTNQRDLADINAPYRCQGCASVMADQRFQKKLSAHIFCKDGLFPANKKIHRGYWLMNPPPPPYLFVLGVTKSQHVVWRAPVNVSDKIILIQHGDDVLRLRKQVLHDAVSATLTLREMAEKQMEKDSKKAKTPLRLMPFTYSDLKGQRVFQSEPQRWLIALMEKDSDAKQIANPLFSLTAQECWALDFCLTDGLEKPEKEII